MADFLSGGRIQGIKGDSLGSSADGTVSGVTLDTTNEKLGSGCYSFDGSNDITTCGSASDWKFLNDKSSDWTMTWWHKNTLGETSNSKAIFYTVDNGGTSDGFYCDYRGGQTMRVGFQGSNGSAGGSAIFYCVFNGGGGTSGGTINSDTNAWVHFAVVVDATAGTVSLYRNGILKYTQTVSAWGSGYDTDFPLYIGGRKDTQFGKFDIDDFAIFKRKLTQAEITSLVNADETTRQGYAGGDSNDTSPYSGAGGGGAGARGGDAVGGQAGNGGVGKTSSITGSSVTYAGGGRGGGDTNGTAGTGSIGQGGNANGASGTDGSDGATGTVILAYTTASGISATGGSIDTSGRSGYKVHTFTSSGTFQITSGSGDVEYLVIAGGGGGGRSNYGNRGAGGGGAGGFLAGTKSSMSSGSYTVTVGSGGAGGTSTTTAGSKGSDSVFDNITAIGGGGGAGHLSSGDYTNYLDTATDGGSGGGTSNHKGGFGLGTVTRNGALVSSLTNKSELKAYYNMDTSTDNVCPNNYISDDRDNIQNVPANTRLELTDVRKIYRRAAGTTPFFETDFGTDDWSDLGNQSANGGDSYSSTTISSNRLKVIATNSGQGDIAGATAVKDLGSALADGNWVIRFTMKLASSGTLYGNSQVWFGLSDDNTYTSSQGANNQNDDAAFFKWMVNDETLSAITYNGGSGGSGSNTGLTRSTAGSELFFEMKYDGTTLTIQRYTDSTYETTTGSATTRSGSNVTGLRYAVAGTEYGQYHGTFNVEFGSFKVYNNTTTVSTASWKERNTA